MLIIIFEFQGPGSLEGGQGEADRHGFGVLPPLLQKPELDAGQHTTAFVTQVPTGKVTDAVFGYIVSYHWYKNQ